MRRPKTRSQFDWVKLEKEGGIALVAILTKLQTLTEQMVKSVHRSLGQAGYLPIVETITGVSTGPRVRFQGREFVTFASNGYLGLADHPKVKGAASRAALTHGAGAGASRFTGGTQDLHRALEEAIAAFKDPTGKSDAIVYSTGYLANIGAIPAIVAPPLLSQTQRLNPEMDASWGKAAIFYDRDNHHCVLDGCMTAQAWDRSIILKSYRHLRVDSLARSLSTVEAERKIVITDGVFSLSGHVAPLDGIVELAEKHDALVYIDDAHGTGVLGENGRGTAECKGVEGRVHINMGTLSKALGGAGGFIVADPEIVEYLRYSSGSYIFQTAMPPAVAAGLIEAIKIVQSEEGRDLRRKLWDNVRYLRKCLAHAGFDTMGSETQIVPVLIGDEATAKTVAERLKDHGIFAPCYYYTAVPRGQAIIRVNIMATHSHEDLDLLVNGLEKAVH